MIFSQSRPRLSTQESGFNAASTPFLWLFKLISTNPQWPQESPVPNIQAENSVISFSTRIFKKSWCPEKGVFTILRFQFFFIKNWSKLTNWQVLNLLGNWKHTKIFSPGFPTFCFFFKNVLEFLKSSKLVGGQLWSAVSYHFIQN